LYDKYQVNKKITIWIPRIMYGAFSTPLYITPKLIIDTGNVTSKPITAQSPCKNDHGYIKKVLSLQNQHSK